MTQLILLEKRSRQVVGTYHLQTMLQALDSPNGSYCGQEFDLEPMRPYFPTATECGRACLSADHRNMKVLIRLWHGIGSFMNLFRQKYLFGCCSLSTIRPEEGWLAYSYLKRKGRLHPELRLSAIPGFHCRRSAQPPGKEALDSYALPKLSK